MYRQNLNRNQAGIGHLVLFVVLFILIVAVGLFAYDGVLAQKSKKDMDAHVTSDAFKNLAAARDNFFTKNDGFLAKVHTCQYKTSDIWVGSSSLFGPVGDGGYFPQMNELRDKVLAAERALPQAYHGTFVSSINPLARSAKQRAVKARTAYENTQKLINNSDALLCYDTLYTFVLQSRYLESYGQTTTLEGPIQNDAARYLDNVKKLRDQANNLTVSNTFSETLETYKIMLNKLAIDLGQLVQIKKSGGSVGALNTSFSSDAISLNTQLLSKASESGKKMTPSLETVQKELEAIK